MHSAAFFNTFAAVEEYGSGVKFASNEKHGSFGTKNRKLIPIMQQTNQTDFKALRVHPEIVNGAYPSNMSVSGTKTGNPQTISAKAGIPALNSGRTRMQEENFAKLASSNRSNFFPSFDSRGNIGLIEDSNEFASFNRKKLRSNLNDPTRESIDEEVRNSGDDIEGPSLAD